MIIDIKNNIANELKMAQELSRFVHQISSASDIERPILEEIIGSLRVRIGVLNDSLGALVNEISIAKPLDSKSSVVKGIERVTIGSSNVALKSEYRDKYLKQLDINEGLLGKLRKNSLVKEKEEKDHRAPNGYAQLANKLFLNWSKRLLEKNYFAHLNVDLRKGNIQILTATYISMMIFTTVIALVLGLFIGVLALFLGLSMDLPFIVFVDFGLSRVGYMLGWLVGLPLASAAVFYFYPYAESRSLAGRIDSELPFVVIHMGSISGSGVEPSQIFKIVGLSKEYKYTRVEMRKILNQINVYGYDLTTALKNIARVTPSRKLAELLNGLSAVISSGGELKTFFERRSETLLLNYRLEREKFTKVAETFMDIYISVVIATPMILLLLLVMISVSGISIGFSMPQLTLLLLLGVALINIVFLWLISLKQPSY